MDGQLFSARFVGYYPIRFKEGYQSKEFVLNWIVGSQLYLQLSVWVKLRNPPIVNTIYNIGNLSLIPVRTFCHLDDPKGKSEFEEASWHVDTGILNSTYIFENDEDVKEIIKEARESGWTGCDVVSMNPERLKPASDIWP